MVTLPRCTATIGSIASLRPVMTSCLISRDSWAFVTPSSEDDGPPVAMPNVTDPSSTTTTIAG
jgi:hypothetical protein